MIIYKTTNLINGKYYIGQDSNNEPSYLGSGLLLKRAIEKYGVDNFKKEILETCDNKDILCKREKFWIKELNARDTEIGYNIAEGGHGGFTKLHDEETKEKLRQCRLGKPSWNKGKPMSEETKRKLSESRKGKKMPPRTEEHREKLRQALLGKKKSKEHCANMSKGLKGKIPWNKKSNTEL